MTTNSQLLQKPGFNRRFPSRPSAIPSREAHPFIRALLDSPKLARSALKRRRLSWLVNALTSKNIKESARAEKKLVKIGREALPYLEEQLHSLPLKENAKWIRLYDIVVKIGPPYTCITYS
ncbi:MAG: hypothetical protein ABIH99_05745 [Candidatus Micrarchaeota archaeon]